MFYWFGCHHTPHNHTFLPPAHMESSCIIWALLLEFKPGRFRSSKLKQQNNNSDIFLASPSVNHCRREEGQWESRKWARNSSSPVFRRCYSKGEMSLLLHICVQKFSKKKKKAQVSDSVFSNFIEEPTVNICIWHNQTAECSKNNIQCLTRTFHPDILKPFSGMDKVHYPRFTRQKIQDSVELIHLAKDSLYFHLRHRTRFMTIQEAESCSSIHSFCCISPWQHISH